MRARGWLSLGMACGVHLALLGAVYSVSPLAPPIKPPASPKELELELEEAPRPIAAAAPSSPPPGEREARRAAQTPGAPTTTTAPSGSTADTEGARASATATTPREGSAGDDWSFSPVAPAQIDPLAPLPPNVVEHLAAPPPESVDRARRGSATGGLAEALAAHDVEVGLGRGGVVLAAAEAAARASDAPLRGDATFDVIVRANGLVDARLTVASVDPHAWALVAAAIGPAVDVRRMRFPPGGRGLRVVVRIQAAVQLADGRDVTSLHGVERSLAPSVLQNALEGKPGARGSSTAAGGPDHVGDDPAEPPPVGGALGSRQPSGTTAAVVTGIAARVLPTPTLSTAGRICSAGVGLTPSGVRVDGSCSMENIGTGTRRVVSGRIVREEAL